MSDPCSIMATMLEEFTQVHDHQMPVAPMNVFQASACPALPVRAYVQRLQKYCNCSEECFIQALILMDRLIFLTDVTLNSLAVHRLVLTALVIAIKMRDDVFYSNAFYASVGGITMKELNSLEASFLTMIKFDLYISMEEYTRYLVTINERYGPFTGMSAEYIAQYQAECDGTQGDDTMMTCDGSVEHTENEGQSSCGDTHHGYTDTEMQDTSSSQCDGYMRYYVDGGEPTQEYPKYYNEYPQVNNGSWMGYAPACA